jgi:GNAT superfamily N-acetyltransferase
MPSHAALEPASREQPEPAFKERIMAERNGPITPRDCAAAFVAAVAHKFAAEANAQISRFGAITAIRYQNEISHPWPRAFQYTLEMMAEDGVEAAGIDGVYKKIARDPIEECAINLLVPDPTLLIRNLRTLGYSVAWQSYLLAIQLQPSSPRQTTAGALRIVKVETPLHIEQTALLGAEQRSHKVALVDLNLHDFLALRDHEPVARAQLVTTNAGIGYIADMFTAPNHRRAGYAGALLQAMHEEAYRLGMTHSVLAPSLMAHQFGVYERYGYHACSPKVVLFRT